METLVDGLLLKARAFEDIGFEVTRDDLRRLAENFRPVPILYEHIEAGLDFGEVQAVWVDGDTLYGRLAFYPEAWQLLERKQIKGLSVAMPWSKTRLLEVSVTSNPREKAARLLASEGASDESRVYIMGELKEQVVRLSAPAEVSEPSESVAEPEQAIELTEPSPAETVTLSVLELRQLQERVAQLTQQQRLAQAREQARQYREQGYITPAQEAVLTAILATEAADTVRFSYGDKERSLGELLQEFVRLNQRFGVGETLGAPPASPKTYDLSAFELSAEGAHLAQLFLQGQYEQAQGYIEQLKRGGKA